MPPFANRVTLITGAASGLGRELARRLAREGAAIAAVDLQAEGLESLAAELKGSPYDSKVADVTDRAGLQEAVARLGKQLGPVDLLIASAGIGFETTAVDFRAEDVERLIQVNLIGVANSIEVVLPGMLERRRGQLVALSSLAAYRGLPRMAGYCASKAGLSALLDGLRLELKPHGISVTTICPGWVRTPLTTNIAVPMPHILEVDEAARQIVEAIRRRRACFAFPPPAVRKMRLLRWLPCGLSDWLTLRALRSLTKKS